MRRINKFLIILLVTLLPNINTFGQVTIGASKAPESFSILEIVSELENLGGLRIPHIETLADRQALEDKFQGSENAKGLLIYNKFDNVLEYWDGNNWIGIGASSGTMNVSNGLVANNDTIQLGGNLDQNTSINTAGNSMSISGNTTNFFSLSNAATTILSADATKNALGVGTNNPDPSAILDIVSTDKGLKLPRVALQATNVGLPVTSPAAGLIVYNTANASSGSTQVFANRMYIWNGTQWTMFVDQATFENALNASLNNLGIPRPAVFQLDTRLTNFLNGITAGARTSVPMNMIANSLADDISFNAATNEITFLQGGLFSMTFVYEGEHNATGCNIASYIVDFPDANGTRGTAPNTVTRIHSTAAFTQGASSFHGGTITCTAFIPAGRVWKIELGRGASGNCNGAGGVLVAKSTHFVVSKIAN